jgi:hypothetical protein
LIGCCSCFWCTSGILENDDCIGDLIDFLFLL